MNNKTLFAALALTAVTSLSAKEVSLQQAISRLNSSTEVPSSTKLRSNVNPSAVNTIYTADHSAALYIYKGSDKTLILPADDRVKPLLGYTDTTVDGEMPEQLQWWLQEYARQIAFLQQQPEHGTGLYINPRSRRESSTKAPISPMVTTRWNQATPYNNQCPLIDGSRAMTGCVATAAAQVMKYFQYPEKGTGSISYTDSYGNSYSMNFASKKFDWANMIDNYSSTYTATQASAVAYLMKAAGYASQMNYATDASGASSTTMLQGLKTYFKYNDKATILSRDNYGLSDWEDMIYNNIANVGPLYYSGDDQSAGHAFVCDGYSQDGYFHFNWGWGGSYDGYFQLTALLPQGQGIGGNAGGFNFGQMATFNVTTPDGTTIDLPEVSPITLLGNLTATKASDQSVTISTDMIDTYGVAFYNSSDETHDFTFKFLAYNENTGAATIQASGASVSGLPSGYGYSSISLPLSLSQGNYQVYPIAYTTDVDENEYTEFGHAIGQVNYFYVTVSSSGKISSVTNATGSELEVANFSLDSQLYWDTSFKYSFTAENNGEEELYSGVYPGIFTISDGSATLIAKGDPTAIDLLGGETRDYTLVSEMTLYTSSFSGAAYFGLISTSTGEILDYFSVDVKEASDVVSLKATTFSFIGDANQANSNDLQFNCGIKCTAGYYVNPMYVYIINYDFNSVLATLRSTETYFLSEGDTASGVVSGAYSDAEIGTSYYAVLGYVSDGYVQTLSYLPFTITGSTSGLTAVSTADAMATLVIADRQLGTISVTSPTEIAAIEAYSIDGKLLPINANISSTTATARMDAMPAGVNMLKVTLSDGTVVIRKVVK